MAELSLPKEAPHKVAGRGVRKAINAAEDVGQKVMRTLDKPLDKMGAPEGPHQIVGNVANAVADTAKDVVRKVTGA